MLAIAMLWRSSGDKIGPLREGGVQSNGENPTSFKTVMSPRALNTSLVCKTSSHVAIWESGVVRASVFKMLSLRGRS